MPRLRLLPLALAAFAASPAQAHWFGFAFNAYTGERSACFVTRPPGVRGFRIVGDRVGAQLTCRRPAACPGRRGTIDAAFVPGTAPESLVGTLSYAGGTLRCDLECEVNAVVGDRPRSFYSCIYRCPPPSRVAVGTFSISRQ
jgi:hypothetical protein